MEFQLGKLLIKSSVKNEILMIIFPVSDHMVSIHIELFRTVDSNSISISTDIYQKDDILVMGKVQRQMEGMSRA